MVYMKLEMKNNRYIPKHEFVKGSMWTCKENLFLFICDVFTVVGTTFTWVYDHPASITVNGVKILVMSKSSRCMYRYWGRAVA